MSTPIQPSGTPEPAGSQPVMRAAAIPTTTGSGPSIAPSSPTPVVGAAPVARPAAPMAKPAGRPAAPAAPIAAAIEADDYEKAGGFSTSFLLFNVLPSYLISFVVHFITVIVLALITIANPPAAFQNTIVAKAPEEAEELQEFENVTPEMNLDPNVSTTEVSSAVAVQATQNQVDPSVIVDVPSTDVDAADAMVELQDFGDRTAQKSDLAKPFGVTGATGLGGRGAAAKGQFNVTAAGGSEASEKAVAMALAWFAEHQNPDGSWNFDHRLCPKCGGKCSEPGKMTDCTTGSTALALLPFLGAGQTHKEGKYKQTVEKGLYYLTSRMKVQNQTGNLAEGGGNLYSHGIASIVLCEGYAMTHDKGLLAPAQLALNYTMFAQDPVGGGWRYTAKQPGDTSAVGWQLMALKSGHMAYLNVDKNTIIGASRFLDSVQADSGSKYGYVGPGDGPATTAVGLLSRMYLGWKQDNPALQKGVQNLAAIGPQPGNMYFNYYATQVMRHAGGEPWEKWNVKMRDTLVNSQAKTGHETGSWIMKGGDHGTDAGGRIYCTAMATMILEVYYRHMPIYGKQAAEEDFPL